MRECVHPDVTYIWADATVAREYSPNACGDQGADRHRLAVTKTQHKHDAQQQSAGWRGNGWRGEDTRRVQPGSP